MTSNDMFEQLSRESRIKMNQEEALSRIEMIPEDEKLDKFNQKAVLELIDQKLEDNEEMMINYQSLEEEYVKWNYIADDDMENKTKAKQDFADVITFFVATGLIGVINIEEETLYINHEQFRRTYTGICESSPVLTKKK